MMTIHSYLVNITCCYIYMDSKNLVCCLKHVYHNSPSKKCKIKIFHIFAVVRWCSCNVLHLFTWHTTGLSPPPTPGFISLKVLHATKVGPAKIFQRNRKNCNVINAKNLCLQLFSFLIFFSVAKKTLHDMPVVQFLLVTTSFRCKDICIYLLNKNIHMETQQDFEGILKLIHRCSRCISIELNKRIYLWILGFYWLGYAPLTFLMESEWVDLGGWFRVKINSLELNCHF